MILNVSRENKGISSFLETIKILSENCFIPITAGGNINSKEIAKAYIDNGADKILLNTLLYDNPLLVKELSNIYGKANIVGCIDFIMNKNEHNINVKVNQGTNLINYDLYEWIQIVSKLEIGEILLQSIDKDGTGNGLFNSLNNSELSNINLPIILMGGIGNYEHILEGFKKKNVNAIATANILNFIGDSFLNTRNLLHEKKVELPSWDLNTFDKLENIFNAK